VTVATKSYGSSLTTKLAVGFKQKLVDVHAENEILPDY
jgi:hypothetical protein